MIKYIGAAALFISLSGCLSAEEVQARRDAEAAKYKDAIYVKRPGAALSEGDPDQLICVVRRGTGTRTSEVKDCRTRREWRDRSIDANREMNNVKEAAGRNWPESD